MIRRAVALGLLGLAVFALSGCGLITLMHDSVLGPVSPLGRINAVTVGSDFRVTDTGPVADLGGDARLRPSVPGRVGWPASLPVTRTALRRRGIDVLSARGGVGSPRSSMEEDAPCPACRAS